MSRKRRNRLTITEEHVYKLISTSGPAKMNFTPDTYFNGDIILFC